MNKTPPNNADDRKRDRLRSRSFHPPFFALVVVALLTLGMAATNWVYHQAVSDQLRDLKNEELENMITTEWKSEGKTRTFSSRWKEYSEKETFPEFLKRHKLEVADAMGAFPEDK